MQLGYTVKSIHRTVVDAEKALEFMLDEPSIKEKENAPDLVITGGKVEFDGVSFKYQEDSAKLTLSALTFCITQDK